MRIFIVGLRRSGTTIFWDTFRQDRRLLCYNEPFNPTLLGMPIEIPNRSRKEFIDVFRKDSWAFWRKFAPIGRIEELQDDFSDRQLAYLRFLIDRADSICLDTTRCHFRLAALQEVVPDATIVHLFRSPAAFATSHLIPTASGGFRSSWLRESYGQVGFFTREDRFNNWGMEEMIGRHPESLFGHRLREIGIDPQAIYELPAAARLLAFWRLVFETVEHDGPHLFGSRFVSVPFEDFCRDPRATVERVYAAAGSEAPEFDLSRIRPAKGAFAPKDPRWRPLFEQVGLSDEYAPGREPQASGSRKQASVAS